MKTNKQLLFGKLLNWPSTFYLILVGIIAKWTTSGGLSFNSKIWDFERDMFNQIAGRSFFSFLFIRDSAGYPIIPMRSIVWVIGNLFDGELRNVTLRLFVILIQVSSFYFAAQLLPGYVSSATRRFSYFILLLLPAEDLNYIHHVGYLLLFPQLYLIHFLDSPNKIKKLAGLICIVFLLNKPITASLLIIYMLIRIFMKDFVNARTIILYFAVIIFSALYLITYLVLPRDLEMPLVSPFDSSPQIVMALPYLVSVITVPSISIGLIGVANLFSVTSLIDVIGYILFFFFLVVVVLVIQKIRPLLKHLEKRDRQLLFSFVLLFLTSYLFVFTIGNFYWVTVFPLWELSYPSHIWMRWSIVPAVLLVLLIVSALDLTFQNSKIEPEISSFKLTLSGSVLFVIVMQYLLLWILGFPYLQRWWGY